MDLKSPRLLLLQILFASVQLCEIPAGNSLRIQTLNAELLRFTEDVSEPPNPSVYLALRLSSDHSQEKEVQYLERLKEAFQPTVSTTPSAVSYQEEPGTGRLALHLLALRAACQDMETVEGRQLVTQLKLHLQKEQQQLGHAHSGHPITNYYQYSLGILTLCVHGKKIDQNVIRKLLHAEEAGKFKVHNKLSVDTEAMAGLAFVCLQRDPFYVPDIRAKLRQAAQRTQREILQAKTSEGALGNIYSTPLAVQFLIAMGVSQETLECPEVAAALLQSLARGDFQNALIKSQLLPALQGKSYLDIAKMQCQNEGDSVDFTTTSPKLELPIQRRRSTHVQLIVKKPPQHLPLYRRALHVPQGSSLLDLLKIAESLGSTKPFTFETQDTLSGPMLTAVMGVKAQEGERRYWKVLRAPNTILEQGIADYIPQDKETILLKFSPW